ncbi:putative thymidylate kinase [uncultured archaeon]|nr:putative thymidylate kinase [uncultured archaeon]
MKGKFIVIEGLDGSGASTQVAMLSEYLASKGYKVLVTKEPTNNLVGGLIRGQLTHEWKSNPECLQLLFAADRSHHLEKEIIPALEKGFIVISDRYMYSSLAFGSIDCDIEWLKSINSKFLKPDVSVILNVPPEVSVERIGRSRAGFELFEDKTKLEKVRAAFDKLSKEYKDVIVIDGTLPVNKVSMAIVREVQKVLS